MDNVRLLPGLREDAEVATHEIGKWCQNLRPPFIAAREARTAAQAPRVVILCLVVLSLGVTIPALGQDQTAAPKDTAASEEDQAEPAYLALRCPSPANPYQRHHDCVRRSFDSLKETLTRDWAGFRTDLANLGITPTLSYAAQFMGNPSGGQDQGSAYAGQLNGSINWDLHKLLRVPGLSVYVSATWATGRDLSAKYIGNTFDVENAFAVFSGNSYVSLQELYLQESLFNGNLTVAAGRLAPGNTFATIPVVGNYLNGGINGNPGSIPTNDGIFTASPPGVEWGGQLTFNFTPTFQFAMGIFNTNPNTAAGADNGVNFSLQQGNSGVLWVTQFSYLYNQGPGATGLQGEYTLGGTYNSGRFASLSNPNATPHGMYQIYAMFQQMLYRDGGPGSQKGLTVWGEASFSPTPSKSTMPYFVGGGWSYQGLIPGRENDIASMGAIYGTFSGYIPQTTGEAVIEANYQINLTPWLSITPDFQYVIKPRGSSSIKNAVVLGAQMSVTF